ncbi:MAG: flagellar motor protein [Gammaproteobacteria bacterium]|nr:flagellar motor protein [Gammaproteobacteria bacterium]
MDILSIAGLIIGIGAIVGGNIMEGGHTSSLMQFTAFVIVTGGTIGAVMIQSPVAVFMRALQIFPWIFSPPRFDYISVIEQMTEWSTIARKEGLLGLEALAESEPDLFARKGLQLLVDGSEPEMIRKILEVELTAKEDRDIEAAKVFDGCGGYAPTIGIIGAVMGLIHVMNNLADPTKLGPGIAVAFVATIYGIGLANLVFLPMANKLKSLIRQRSQFQEMLIDGIVAISEGENPRNIETKLKGYVV